MHTQIFSCKNINEWLDTDDISLLFCTNLRLCVFANNSLDNVSLILQWITLSHSGAASVAFQWLYKTYSNMNEKLSER